MTDHHTRHNLLRQDDAFFATPASLMLDARLTPLEHNGWQVLRMCAQLRAQPAGEPGAIAPLSHPHPAGAKELGDKLDNITDPHVRMSLRLQATFGLRREESIKFQPRYADRGNYIAIKGSWAKGGRDRRCQSRRRNSVRYWTTPLDQQGRAH